MGGRGSAEPNGSAGASPSRFYPEDFASAQHASAETGALQKSKRLLQND